ncbi:hypothetical protein [Micropruina sonneratiae]|uniref:hypothetical protein n=1 Tax=Micropruina sonneratiae TaxID=2986940 RepID=UPI0022278094|nr:hypothetical protein [Micropruina sp. KQZ13P-5]MCW3159529.1 hypothetical protein [Micropruina sp. KQZ13P-5]
MSELVPLVQWLGMAVTMLGLVIVAPSDLGALVAQMVSGGARAAHKARGWLAERLPFLRGQVKVRHRMRLYDLRLEAHGAQVIARVLPNDEGRATAQLAQVREAIASIYAELDGLREAHETVRVALVERLHALTERVEALEQQVRQDTQTRRKLNGKGLPLAAGGALVGGWPSEWLTIGGDGAALNLGGWLLLGSGLALLAVGFAWMVQARGEVAQGWRHP